MISNGPPVDWPRWPRWVLAAALIGSAIAWVALTNPLRPAPQSAGTEGADPDE